MSLLMYFIFSIQVSPGFRSSESGLVSYNPAAAILQDKVSIASAKEYFLQPEDVHDDTPPNSAPSTPKKLRQVVSSSEMKVTVFHAVDNVYTNPFVLEEETSSEQLSQTKENLGSE